MGISGDKSSHALAQAERPASRGRLVTHCRARLDARGRRGPWLGCRRPACCTRSRSGSWCGRRTPTRTCARGRPSAAPRFPGRWQRERSPTAVRAHRPLRRPRARGPPWRLCQIEAARARGARRHRESRTQRRAPAARRCARAGPRGAPRAARSRAGDRRESHARRSWRGRARRARPPERRRCGAPLRPPRYRQCSRTRGPARAPRAPVPSCSSPTILLDRLRNCLYSFDGYQRRKEPPC